MTTILKIKGSNFEGLGASFAPAVTADLAGWWYPNGTMPKAVKNLASGRAPAAALGLPVVSAHSIALDGVNGAYLQTDAPESESMTLLAVLRSSDTQADAAHRPHFVTTFGGLSNENSPHSTSGVGLFSVGVNTLQLTSAGWNGTETTTRGITVPCDYSKWSFVVGRAGPLSRHLWNITDNASSGGATPWRRDPANSSVRMGKRWATSSSSDGRSDIAFTGVYNRYLADDEVAAIYVQVKKYLGDLHGISI